MAANDKEIWKQVPQLKGKTTKNYAISSHGRMASYDKKIDDKFILKLHLNGGFPMATIHVEGKSKALFVHKTMGAAFLKKNSSKDIFVLHLDYNKANNELSNLKWATKKEQIEHSKKSPYVLQAAARKVYTGNTARKLNEKKVTALKKEIWNPKRTVSLKQIAAKYGIAEMNLYRIKNGELWFHVQVEGEPVFPKYKEQLKNIAFHNKIAAQQKAVQDKKNIAKAIRVKAKAQKDKTRATEKKQKLDLREKNRKAKAVERIAIEKRKLIRAAAAKKVKDLKLKKSAKSVAPAKLKPSKKTILKKVASKKVVSKKATKKTATKK